MNELLNSPVIAALVSAAGSVIGKIITWVGEKGDSGKADADVAIQEAYATLRGAFTDGCVRILKALENGQLAHALMVRQRDYTDLILPDHLIAAFDGELRYRLEYMRLHGVLATVGPTEYGITSLGQAFLEEARRRRDYPNVLFGS
jgi:hypothetical protein